MPSAARSASSRPWRTRWPTCRPTSTPHACSLTAPPGCCPRACRAHATLLSRLGVRVVVNDIGGDLFGANPDPTRAEALAAELRGRGGEAVADTADIRTFDGAAAAVQHTVEAFGRIDILINNAG